MEQERLMARVWNEALFGECVDAFIDVRAADIAGDPLRHLESRGIATTQRRTQ